MTASPTTTESEGRRPMFTAEEKTCLKGVAIIAAFGAAATFLVCNLCRANLRADIDIPALAGLAIYAFGFVCTLS